jgi:O-antigen ligase/cytochrome c-type biogenesis protein CcmH/NrfG
MAVSSGVQNKKFVIFVFIGLVILALLTPFWVFRDLLFPFVTSKAFYLRILVELALPFYVFLLLRFPEVRPSFKNPLTISVTAFFLLNLLSGFFGVNVLRSIWGNYERMGGAFYLGHLVLLYFYVLMIGQINSRYFRLFLQFVVGIGAAVSLDAVMVRLTHNNFLLNDPSYPRVSGTFGNPIFIASFLVVPIFLAAFFAVSENVIWKKIYYWAAAALGVLVIFLSQTRGAVVGLGVGIFLAAVLYVILTPARKLKVWGGITIAVVAAAVMLLFVFHSSFPQGSLLHRVFNLDDSNTKSRLIEWGVALKGYKDHPLLGVGPENYYVIGNKYYNPAIFQYDPSWFDKPHNYLIEVLVTSGIFGFLAYLSILGFSLWALWAAFRKGILVLSEFCLLACGLVVYQIQNLTVFDTVGASMAFFAYIGFMGYLWHESYRAEKPAKKSSRGFADSTAYTLFGITALIMLYTLYVCNIVGMQTAAEINFGYAYLTASPALAKSFFDQAQSSLFNFDPIQSASKYSAFASAVAAAVPQTEPTDFIKQSFSAAASAEQSALAKVSNDPTGWQDLANLYLNQAVFNKTTLNPDALVAAQKSIVLAPLRPEGPLLLARLDLFQNNVPAAEALIAQVIGNIPEDNSARLELGLTYAENGQVDKGLAIAQSGLNNGYSPTDSGEIQWMADDYNKENNFSAAANIYAMLVKIDPGNLENLWLLAQMDAKIGQTQQAIQIAQSLIKSDPNDASHFQQFINSLQ